MAHAVTDDTFEAEVVKSDLPVLVDFWAEWCGPCRQIAPIIETLATEMEGKLKVVKMDVENSPQTPSGLGIRGIPTLMIFKDGQVVGTKVGAAPRGALEAWINETIG